MPRYISEAFNCLHGLECFSLKRFPPRQRDLLFSSLARLAKPRRRYNALKATLSRDSLALPNKFGKMHQVAALDTDEDGIQESRNGHRNYTNQSRPLKLVRTREDNGGGVGANLKNALPGCFDRREGPSHFWFNALRPRSATTSL